VNPADLVVQFPDGSETVFPNYIPLAQAGAPPVLTLEDGTVIPGVEIVGLIENLDYDKIATAAGDPGAGGQTTTGGGAGFLADPSGLLGDDIGHGPYAGGIKIADEVGFEQLPSENGSDVDEDDLPFEAIDDHVIHNIQAEDYFRFQGSGFDPLTNPIDIPDTALRHNDIYPRGSWDLESVHSPSPDYNPTYAYPGENPNDPFPADPLEDPAVSNTDPNLDPNTHDLGTSTFDGTNTTSRFTGTDVEYFVNNNGIDYAALNDPSETVQVDDAARLDWDKARFILETQAPGGSEPDWDGARIWLFPGETITMTPHSWLPAGDTTYIPGVGAIPGPRSDPGGADWTGNPNFYMSIDIDGLSSTGVDQLYPSTPAFLRFGWDVTGEALTGPISYTMPEDLTPADGLGGYVYLGIGHISGNVTPEGMYRTMVVVEGVPYGEFDYEATDEVLSDGAHVTVDAREEGTLYDSGNAGRGEVDVIE
ncbi:MAG: hypothetical protein GY779_15285, partial [Gammaproteobacteria bacterium]|nr:hypothetical protein [Gammaproteobacteria bacterium]